MKDHPPTSFPLKLSLSHSPAVHRSPLTASIRVFLGKKFFFLHHFDLTFEQIILFIYCNFDKIVLKFLFLMLFASHEDSYVIHRLRVQIPLNSLSVYDVTYSENCVDMCICQFVRVVKEKDLNGFCVLLYNDLEILCSMSAQVQILQLTTSLFFSSTFSSFGASMFN